MSGAEAKMCRPKGWPMCANEDTLSEEIVIHPRIYLLLVNKPLAQLASFVCAMEITLRE